MYTVKQFMQLVYPIINQHGISYAVWPNNIIGLVNMWINMIYNYEWMHWSWQHRKDLFNMNEMSQWALLSRWPVRKIDKFWWGNWKDVDKVWIEPCFCNLNLPDKNIIKPCCECNCIAPCKPLDLQQVLPQNKLCANQYQISWSFIWGMGWLDWRIVKVDLWNLVVDDLWMSYFCGPSKVEKFSDIIPLPDSFIQCLVWIVWASCIPQQGIARQQDDLSLYSLYRKELDYLRKQDTIAPETLEIPDNMMPHDSTMDVPPVPFTTVNIGNTW